MMRCHIQLLYPNAALCLPQAFCKNILRLCTALAITVLPAAHSSPRTEAPMRPLSNPPCCWSGTFLGCKPSWV